MKCENGGYEVCIGKRQCLQETVSHMDALERARAKVQLYHHIEDMIMATIVERYNKFPGKKMEFIVLGSPLYSVLMKLQNARVACNRLTIPGYETASEYSKRVFGKEMPTVVSFNTDFGDFKVIHLDIDEPILLVG